MRTTHVFKTSTNSKKIINCNALDTHTGLWRRRCTFPVRIAAVTVTVTAIIRQRNVSQRARADLRAHGKEQAFARGHRSQHQLIVEPRGECQV